MPRRQDGNQVLVEELGRHDLVAAQGEGDDGQIELARGELLLQLDARTLGDVEVDVGMAHAEQVEELGDQPATRGADHAESDRPDDLLAQGRHVRDHRLELVHDLAGPGHHDLALLGQAPRGPVHELHVELALQAGHVRRDVGLHGADGGGRCREAAGVSDPQERLQVFQFH